jgi:multidrug efflux pump subunit AcrB
MEKLMSQHRNDEEIINNTRNTSRFFVETRHVAWVLLIATCLWGVYGYLNMPRRKDPEVQVRTAVALTPWRGASAEKVEQLVTKKIETQIAASARVTKIESISRTGLSVVYLDLDENLKETGKELDDIKLKLDGVHDLPDGAGPINFVKDFGDTAALMLTVASPKASELEIELRAKTIQTAIEQARFGDDTNRAALVVCLPQAIDLQLARKHRDLMVEHLKEQELLNDARPLEGAGFIGIDATVSVDDAALLSALDRFVRERLQAAEFHPDAWQPAVIRAPQETKAKLTAVAGDKYSYRELDQFTDLIEKTLKTLPTVSKVSRTGLLDERIYLYYSQERLASYGIQNAKLPDILSARNITLPGGQLAVEGKNLSIDPTSEFIYSLPVVLTCSLVASRLVSMTFIPLLGYYLLRPKAEPSLAERRTKGFAAFYYRVGNAAINHRWKFLAGSLAFLALGGFFGSQLKQSFFPKDLSYLSYVDVWLPEDAPLIATNEAAQRAEEIIRRVTNEHGDVLKSLTTFIGGGGPRFWFSVAPELQQLNYAQLIIQVKDKHDTGHLIAPLQAALSAEVAGARIDVRQLESGKAVGLPVQIRLSGEDAATLRAQAEQVKAIFRALPNTTRVRDDWGDESFTVKLRTDPDRANLAGVTNYDVAAASSTAITGQRVTSLREGDKQIPVVARLRMEERAQLADLNNLYVYSSQGATRVPLGTVSTIEHGMQTEKLRRRNQFRTITVSCFPKEGRLPSEVMKAAREKLNAFADALPPGYKMEIGGEEEDQVKGFKDLTVVLLISIVAIFLALVFQFKHAVKPLIVFAAIPFGMVGALAALWVMGTPFGFMAFLGCVSLVGVIVSHVIVLFDFIEEAHEHGAPLREALLDAGIMRLRPVLITVGATVIALFPLARHGGPLWEPMCYAQIGGLSVATFVTLLLVPVLYAIFVLDLRLVRWSEPPVQAAAEAPGGTEPTPA